MTLRSVFLYPYELYFFSQTKKKLVINVFELSRLRVGNCHVLPQGGAHEGLQLLGPFGNIPNFVAELTGDNVPKDVTEDHGYPDPPNPCPVGKAGTGFCVRADW